MFKRILSVLAILFVVMGTVTTSAQTLPQNLISSFVNFGTNSLQWNSPKTNGYYFIYAYTNAITAANKSQAFQVYKYLPANISNFKHNLQTLPQTRNTNNRPYYYAVTHVTQVTRSSWLKISNHTANPSSKTHFWKSGLAYNGRFNVTNRMAGFIGLDFYVKYVPPVVPDVSKILIKITDNASQTYTANMSDWLPFISTNWLRVFIPASHIFSTAPTLTITNVQRVWFDNGGDTQKYALGIDEIYFKGQSTNYVWYGDAFTNTLVSTQWNKNFKMKDNQGAIAGGLEGGVAPGTNATVASSINRYNRSSAYPFYTEYSGTWNDYLGLTGNVSLYDTVLGTTTLTNVEKAMKWVREYLSWPHIEDKTNDHWDFTANYANWPNHFGWYKKAASLGVNVLAGFLSPNFFAQSASDNVTNSFPVDSLIPYNQSVMDTYGYHPTNYKEHSEAMAQISARYGGFVHDNLGVIEPSDKLTGWGYLKYIQNYNEPNFFVDRKGNAFDSGRFAAMINADYDRKFFPNASYPNLPLLGAKSGDPNITHVLAAWPGVTPDTIQYLYDVVHSPHTIASGRLPFEVMAINIYTFDWDNKSAYQYYYDKDPIWPIATSPEDPTYGIIPQWNRAETFKSWYLPPEMPIWVTEYGWDTGRAVGTPGYMSPCASFTPYDNTNMQWAQANYLVRGAALFAGLGSEKSFIFHQSDDAKGSFSYGLYESSGVFSNSWNSYRPKTSFYHLATLRNVVGDMTFRYFDNFRSMYGTNEIWSCVYQNLVTGEGAKMVWTRYPKRKYDVGAFVTSYTSRLPGQPTSCTMIIMTNKSLVGRRSPLTVQSPGTLNAYVVVPRISENPVLLKIDNALFPNTRPVNVKTTSFQPGMNLIRWEEAGGTNGNYTYTIYCFTNQIINEQNLASAFVLASNVSKEYRSFYHNLDDFPQTRIGSSMPLFYAVVFKSNGLRKPVYPGINAGVDSVLNPIKYDGPFYIATNGHDWGKGDVTSPLKTFEHALERMLPNRTVCTTFVRGGTYTRQNIRFLRSGTKQTKIVFKNYPGERPHVVGWTNKIKAVYFGYPYEKNEDRDWCWVEGFKFSNFTNVIWMETGDNNSVVNCTFSNFKGSAIFIQGSTESDQAVFSNRMVNNTVYGTLGEPAFGAHNNGGGPIKHIQVYGNKVYDAKGIFEVFGGGVSNLHFVRNEVVGCTNFYYLISVGSNQTIQNLIHHSIMGSCNPSTPNAVVRGNVFYSNTLKSGFSKMISVGIGPPADKKIRDNIVLKSHYAANAADGATSTFSNETGVCWNNNIDVGANFVNGYGYYLHDPIFVNPEPAGGDYHFKNGYVQTLGSYLRVSNQSGGTYFNVQMYMKDLNNDNHCVTNSGATHLEMWVRDFAAANWNQVGVRVVTPGGTSANIYFGAYTNGWGGAPTASWKKISIPLSAFGSIRFDQFRRLEIGVNSAGGGEKFGLDEIAFVGNGVPYLFYGDYHPNVSLVGNAFSIKAQYFATGGASVGRFWNTMIGTASADNGIRAARGNHSFWVKPSNITNFKRTVYTNIFTTTSVGSVPADGYIYIQYPLGTYFDSPTVTTKAGCWGGGAATFIARDLGNGLLEIKRNGGNPSVRNTTELLVVNGVINPSASGTNTLFRATWWTTDSDGDLLDWPDQSHDYYIIQANPYTFGAVHLQKSMMPMVAGSTLASAKPGATLRYSLDFVSDGNTPASNVIIYDKFPNKVLYKALSKQLSATNWSVAGWTNQFSTLAVPDQSFASAQYLTNDTPAGLRWIRTKGPVMGLYQYGKLRFDAIVTNNYPAGTVLTNIAFSTARNNRDFNLNPIRYTVTNFAVVGTNFGGRLKVIPDKTTMVWGPVFYTNWITNLGNAASVFYIRPIKVFASSNDFDKWQIKACGMATTNTISNTSSVPMGGSANFRLMITPSSAISNGDWMEFILELRPNRNTTMVRYVGDDGRLYGGDIGDGLDLNGLPATRPGAIFQRNNNLVRVAYNQNITSTSLTVKKSISNISLMGVSSAPKPGATIIYTVSYTNIGPVDSIQSRIVDFISTNTVYMTNMPSSASGWTIQYATNLWPDGSWLSTDYKDTITFPKEKIRWIRWKKATVGVNEDGLTLKYKVIVK